MSPSSDPSLDWSRLQARLTHSTFRSRFKLSDTDAAYIARKGISTIESHASDFISKRLQPASPAKDGHQTPMRGHPVFVAQHATATCCRGCLAKWHGLSTGRELSEEELSYVCQVILHWIEDQVRKQAALFHETST